MLPDGYDMQQILPGESPDYLNERTGRCHNCKIRFIWPTKMGRLRDMKCPVCGSQLRQTTHMWKGETYRIFQKEKKHGR